MLQIFIIVFREILEIAIILSIVLAATKNLKNRNIWIINGISLGVFGSILIALFTSAISNAFDGQGQEYFNAAIVSITCALLVWTVVWMKKQGQLISKKIKDVSNEIHAGRSSFISLMLIIASTIFREGSEIVLFTYGSYASHKLSIASIFSGCAAGFTLGAITGYAVYHGVIRFAGKYIFQFTFLLVSLIAAGMAAQAINFLNASGLITVFSYPIWDSTAFLSDGSLVGQILNVLIGYNAQPTLLQFAAYASTLILIWVLTKFQKT
jgi:high-affinity iron transporter